MLRQLWLCGTLSAALTGCGGGGAPDPPGLDDPARATITLSSPAFSDGGPIPKLYTCDGKDVSPPLAWGTVPPSAVSLALVCDDPDAPRGTWTHWLLFNVAPDVKGLPEAVEPVATPKLAAGPSPAAQGVNDFGKPGYGGPCPPSGVHHYVFRLYALDVSLPPAAGASRKALLGALKGHVLAHGRLVGIYRR